jgi:hypothetical protein
VVVAEVGWGGVPPLTVRSVVVVLVLVLAVVVDPLWWLL